MRETLLSIGIWGLLLMVLGAIASILVMSAIWGEWWLFGAIVGVLVFGGFVVCGIDWDIEEEQ